MRRQPRRLPTLKRGQWAPRPIRGGAMQDFQKENAVVRRFHETLSKSTADTLAQDLACHTTATWHWRGIHPFHEQHGAEAVAGAFWVPFLNAMSRVQMRPDISWLALTRSTAISRFGWSRWAICWLCSIARSWASGRTGASSCSDLWSSIGLKTGASPKRLFFAIFRIS